MVMLAVDDFDPLATVKDNEYVTDACKENGCNRYFAGSLELDGMASELLVS